MYSFDNLSSSLGSISSALALPVSRGRHRKLLDNFSHESDFTSLQDPFTSRPYKTPFYFYYWVPRKIPRGILFQIHVEYSPSSRLLVSDHCSLRHCVKDYDSLVLSPCSTTVFALDCFSHWTTTSAIRLFYRTGHSLLQTNLLIPINRLLHVGLKSSIYGRAASL